MPDFVDHQHPMSFEVPPQGPEWLHEVKYDGYRIQVRVERGQVSVHTRNGLNWTDRFPALAQEAARLPDCILDGELCALDGRGHPDFEQLRSRIGKRETDPLVFFAFDLLFLSGEDLRARRLEDRKAELFDLLDEAGLSRVRFLEHLDAPGAAVFEMVCRMGLEGIVSRRRDAPYKPGERTSAWRKVKCRPAQDVVIVGWRTENGHRFRSLMAAVREPDGSLRYAGRIHTGYNPKNTAGLLKRLGELEVPSPPAMTGDPPRKTPDIHFVRPLVTAEIEIENFTAAGKIRQGSFKRWREEAAAPPRAVAPKAAAGAEAPALPSRAGKHSRRKRGVLGVDIPDPDVVVAPGLDGEPPVTRLALAEYVADAADGLLAYVRGRPCSVLLPPAKPPRGDDFERHAGQGKSSLAAAPEVSLVHLPATGKTYFQFDNPSALVAAVAHGAVEFHAWQSWPGDPGLPGRFVVDLDPDEHLPFVRVVEAALEVRARLEGIGLSCWPKTTGGKGLHVVAEFTQDPDDPVSWEPAKAFIKRVCERMAQDSPELYTVALQKAHRGGRIFLDYLRNGRTNTAVAAWSPRLRPGAPVSAPLHWSEVRKGLDPSALRLGQALDLERRSRAIAAAPAPKLRDVMRRWRESG